MCAGCANEFTASSLHQFGHPSLRVDHRLAPFFTIDLRLHRRARLQRDDASWQQIRTVLHGKTINCGLAIRIKSMYSPLLLEHFERPRNVGEIEDADARVTVENPACGDVMVLTLKVG